MSGGRGSGKTYSVTTVLSILAHQRNLTVCVAREHLKSIQKSALPALELRMKRLGLIRPDCFQVLRDEIRHANGSRFWFIGLSKVSEEDIKGLEEVDICWVEEAHMMSARSWEILRPTIRKDGAEVWFTYNPKDRTAPVHRLTLRDNPRVWHRHVIWSDNPWFPERSNRDRLDDLEDNPARYAHIWLGEPDDGDADTKILSYDVVRKCVEAHRQGLCPPYKDAPFVHGGLDLAFGGIDKCALVLRRGPEIFHVDLWPGVSGDALPAVLRAHETMTEHGGRRLYFDATGGDTIRALFFRDAGASYQVEPVNFGGAVNGADIPYEVDRTNGETFARLNAQGSYALRLRANRTVRLMKGQDVDPNRCLFIDPEIPRLEEFLAELSRPMKRVNPTTGKIEIDKRGDEEKSPDMFDAAWLSFLWDTEGGLWAR